MFTIQAPRIAYVAGATLTLAAMTCFMAHELYKTYQDVKRKRG